MKKLLGVLSLFTLLCLACQSEDTKAPEAEATPAETPVAAIDKETTPSFAETVPLIVNIDNLRLRSTAGEQGAEVGRLPEGTVLQDLGEVSDFTTKVRLRGIWFDEPWLKVRTDKGLEGWVYGGAVRFDVDNRSKLTDMLLRKRLQTFFGPEQAQLVQNYYKDFKAAKTSEALAQAHFEGKKLVDHLNTLLENKIAVDETNQLPDLFWLEETLPGYVPQLVAEGTVYQLLQDFRDFGAQAALTSGQEDDDFAQLNYEVYGLDSVENYFPTWFIQTWDYGGHSLLGQGKHLAILTTIDKTLAKGDLFLEEIMPIKDRLLDDILTTGNEEVSANGFWEPQKKILQEMDDILAADIVVLSDEDKIALKTRRDVLANAKANGIKMNHRSGQGG